MLKIAKLEIRGKYLTIDEKGNTKMLLSKESFERFIKDNNYNLLN